MPITSCLRRANKLSLTKILAGSEHNTTISALGKEKDVAPGSPTVRFASVDEEIKPEPSLHAATNEISGGDEATLKELSKSLQGTQLQGRRMSHFAFEPVSLPASRVCLSSQSKVQDRMSKYPEVPKGHWQVLMGHAQMGHHVAIAKWNRPGFSLGCRLYSTMCIGELLKSTPTH